MSEKKIVVPKAMRLAAAHALMQTWGYNPDHVSVDSAMSGNDHILDVSLQSALRWLSENPIVPSDDQVEEMCRFSDHLDGEFSAVRATMMAWPMRMFLAPEPAVPEEIKDLLVVFTAGGVSHKAIVEAYRRGRVAK